MNNNYLVLLMLLIPLGEIVLDKFLWSLKLPDKPASTIVRVVAFAMFMLMFELAGLSSWWQTFLLAFAIHFLVFDYALNIVREKNIFYVSDNGHWYENLRKKLPWYGELLFKIWFFLVAWGFYAHLDWIV